MTETNPIDSAFVAPEITTTLFREGRPKAKHLLVVNKGPGAETILREGEDWDLLEIYFMKSDIEAIKADPSIVDADYVVFETHRRKRKFEIVQAIFKRYDFWKSYDAVMLADDDLVPVGCTIKDVFELFDRTGCGVGQPALTQDSYFSHMLTLQNTNFTWRRTNFAEVMCTIFSRQALEDYLHIFTGTSSGLFLDHYWSYKEWVKGVGCAILDATPVRHCRPVFGGIAYQGISQEETYPGFIAEHGIPQYPQSCIGGEPTVPLDPLTDQAMLGLKISGYANKFIRETNYIAYCMDEIGIYLNLATVRGMRNGDERSNVLAHVAATGLFMSTRDVGAFVKMFGEDHSPQTLVDHFWDSTSWRITRPLRDVTRAKGAEEKRPRVYDAHSAYAVVTDIVSSTSWEMLGPLRALARVFRRR